MLSRYDEESSGSDSDTGLAEDMEAVRRAFSVTGVDDSVDDLPKSSTPDVDDEATYDSEDEDRELLRNIQQRFSVPTTDIGTEQQPIFMKPLNTILPSSLLECDDDYGDDFETLRAIQRRFSQYNDSMNSSMESSLQRSEQVGATNIDLEKESSNNFFVKRINNGQGFPDCVDRSATTQTLDISSNITPDTPYANVSEGHEPGSEIVPVTDCGGFPRSAQAFVEAIKKNRTYQKFIRNKLVQIEAKMEENGKLRERVKILKDFQVACRKRTGRALSQKKDPRIQLISVPKPRANAKAKDKNIHATSQGPAENPHVAYYRRAMSIYPLCLSREPWSKEEKENLLKGIKQQFQKMLVDNFISAGDLSDLDSVTAKIRDREISPEEIRKFLPQIDWKGLSSMYLAGRSGPECQSRWINCEDLLINREPWKPHEDKKILFIVQNEKHSDWIDLAEKLGTNRTPFQCLSRFQRSLNASIIKNEWTRPEDEELRNAVAEYGDTNWQLVASTLEGRTGTQCSNRWKKSLNPLREKVGKWAPDEDVHLKIAVRLFGAKNWNKISKFVPGRTQVQCRERWVNCLDPSLNMNKWTEEEDLKLKAAIEKHGYSWSRIAACVPPRTDSQCRRRWKVLLPHEVPMLQAARQMKKAAFISNFVDREEERPALTLDDFIAPLRIESAHEANEVHSPKKQKRKMPPKQCGHDSSSGTVFKVRSRRARKVTHTEKVLHLIDEDDVEDDGGNADITGNSLNNMTIISSGGAEILDLNNGEGARVGASDGDNVDMKKKTTGKRKRKRGGNKEHEQMNETLETNDISNQKMMRPCVRTNKASGSASVDAAESQLQEDAEVILANETSVINTCASLSPQPSKAKRKRKKVAISGINDGVSKNEPCSSQQITLMSTGEERPQVETPKKGKKLSKRPNMTEGDKPQKTHVKTNIRKTEGSTTKLSRTVNEVDDEETLASFINSSRTVNKRGGYSEIAEIQEKEDDGETLAGFINRVKKRRLERCKE